MYNIYRAVSNTKDAQSKLFVPHSTMRPPGNVPYIVDNLWEWARPFKYLNRRLAAFASPTPELASEAFDGACCVYRVEFPASAFNNVCQLIRPEKNNKDSKFHQECKSLKKKMIKSIGVDFFSGEFLHKQNISALWMPCLKKEETESFFQNSDQLKGIKDELYNFINYWNDVVLLKDQEDIPDNQGELFFEYPDGYYLRSV